MHQKLKQKNRAEILRRRGFSLSEISQKLRVSKSSASLWLRGIVLSPHAERILSQKKREGREKALSARRARIAKRRIAEKEYGETVFVRASFNADAFRVICALLYWCEGQKLDRPKGKFAFTNSDPMLVSTFLRLLRNGFSIDEKKLRITLHVHEYHDAQAQLRFWSKVTTIPLAQCHKPYQKPHTGLRKRKGYQGCVSVTYLDTGLGRKIEGIAQAFLQKGP